MLISIAQSYSARDAYLTWKRMTLTTPSSNKELRKSIVKESRGSETCWKVCAILNLDHVKWLVNFTLSVNKYHDRCFSGTIHHSSTEVYAMSTIKHKDGEHWKNIWFLVLNLLWLFFSPPAKCISWTTYWDMPMRNWCESAPSQPDILSKCWFNVGPTQCCLEEHIISHVRRRRSDWVKQSLMVRQRWLMFVRCGRHWKKSTLGEWSEQDLIRQDRCKLIYYEPFQVALYIPLQ